MGANGGGGGSLGKRSWSLARAVVCVVMGAVATTPPSMETRFCRPQFVGPEPPF